MSFLLFLRYFKCTDFENELTFAEFALGFEITTVH